MYKSVMRTGCAVRLHEHTPLKRIKRFRKCSSSAVKMFSVEIHNMFVFWWEHTLPIGNGLIEFD